MPGKALLTREGIIVWLKYPRAKDFGYNPNNMVGLHFNRSLNNIHLKEFEKNFNIAASGQAVGYISGLSEFGPAKEVLLFPVEGGVYVIFTPLEEDPIPEPLYS